MQLGGNLDMFEVVLMLLIYGEGMGSGGSREGCRYKSVRNFRNEYSVKDTL